MKKTSKAIHIRPRITLRGKLRITRAKSFATLNDYFDYISETLQVPRTYPYFQSDSVWSDGLKLHVDVLEHHPDSPTVVFIPGTAAYGLCYGYFLYMLSKEGYNIVAFDPRGHGQSEGRRGDYSISDIVADGSSVITYAINRFNKKVSVMGSSQGGIAAFYLAAQDNRIDTAVCQTFADLSSSKMLQLTRRPQLFKHLRRLLMKYGKDIPNVRIPIGAYLRLKAIPVRYFGNARNFVRIDPLALKSVSLRALRSLAYTPMAKPIEEITVPIMLTQGDADQVFPLSYTRSIFDRLRCRKKMVLFPGGSHSVLHEDPEGCAREVGAWLRQIYGVDARSNAVS